MNLSREKKKLQAESDLYKDELEKELKIVKHQTNELLKNALIIGGSLTLTYILFRQLSARKRKKKYTTTNTLTTKSEGGLPVEVAHVEQPSRFSMIASDIGSTILNEATFFLLNLAKEKLLELLAPKEQTPSEDDDS